MKTIKKVVVNKDKGKLLVIQWVNDILRTDCFFHLKNHQHGTTLANRKNNKDRK